MSQTSPVCGHTLNLDNLHFTPDEVRSLNELVVTAVLQAPELSQYHTLVTGIKNDRRIGIIPGTFGLVGKAAQSCNPVAQCYEDVAIEKTWSPKYMEVIIDMCVDELNDTLMKLAINCGVDLINHPFLDRPLCAKIKLHFRNLKHALIEKKCSLVVHGKGILADI